MGDFLFGLFLGAIFGFMATVLIFSHELGESNVIHQRNNADFIELIEECEKELPRNQYCKITVHP